MSGRDALSYPDGQRAWLDPFLPDPARPTATSRPHVTLTFATSLDSALSLAPGAQTALSGPRSKAMTHYLRAYHDAILVGVTTATVDDPSLNCRLVGVGGYGGEGLSGQPRPIVVDPGLRWDVTASKVLQLAKEGRGKAPWIVCSASPDVVQRKRLEDEGGRYIVLEVHQEGKDTRLSWSSILNALHGLEIKSIMIEGGATVINALLADKDGMIDSVIVTIAPTWLGPQGAVVAPQHVASHSRGVLPVARLKQPQWNQLGDDVVLCGYL